MNDNGNISIIAFDVGGTWLRSGVVLPDGTLVDKKRDPSISFMNYPDLSVDCLQQALVDYVIDRVSQLRLAHAENNIQTVIVAIGAPVNANTEIILNSGPIWGPKSKPFDLKRALHAKETRIHWSIVNDITASLLFYADQMGIREKRVTLITISTGSGLRTFDVDHQTIPVDPKFGIQGEIGHIPISFFINNQRIHAVCDCGGQDHFNAFCSGRGIERLLPLFAEQFKTEYQASSFYSKIGGHIEWLNFSHLIESCNHADTFAEIVLQQVTRPLAEIIIYQLTLDPEVKKIILVGGVVNSLHSHFYDALIDNLNEIGLYQISDQDPAFFQHHIVIGEDNDNAGLMGAALYVAQKERLTNRSERR